MNMEKVKEIIKLHNELLDAMTEEERIQYYAKYGMIIQPKKENNEEKPKGK